MNKGKQLRCGVCSYIKCNAFVILQVGSVERTGRYFENGKLFTLERNASPLC